MIPEGFSRKLREPCPDCLDRGESTPLGNTQMGEGPMVDVINDVGDVDLLGHVRKGRHVRVKDCETCQGRGWVRPEKTVDPYFTGRGV